MLCRQNESNFAYFWLALTSIWFVFYVSLPNEIKLLLFNIFFFENGSSTVENKSYLSRILERSYLAFLTS